MVWDHADERWEAEIEVTPRFFASAERDDAQFRRTLPCQQTAPARGTIGNSGLNHAAIIRGNFARAPSDLCVLLRR
jgi:hypothetical protein